MPTRHGADRTHGRSPRLGIHTRTHAAVPDTYSPTRGPPYFTLRATYALSCPPAPRRRVQPAVPLHLLVLALAAACCGSSAAGPAQRAGRAYRAGVNAQTVSASSSASSSMVPVHFSARQRAGCASNMSVARQNFPPVFADGRRRSATSPCLSSGLPVIVRDFGHLGSRSESSHSCVSSLVSEVKKLHRRQ